MSNSAFNASTESTTKECYVTIDELSIFIDVPMKDDTPNHHGNVLHHAKENNATMLAQPKKIILLHIMAS